MDSALYKTLDIVSNGYGYSFGSCIVKGTGGPAPMSSGKRRDDVANGFVHMLLWTTGRIWTAPTAGPRNEAERVSIVLRV